MYAALGRALAPRRASGAKTDADQLFARQIHRRFARWHGFRLSDQRMGRSGGRAKKSSKPATIPIRELRAEIEQRAATEAALRAEDTSKRAATEAALRAEIEQRAATEAALRAEIEQRAATEAALRAEIEQRAATEAALRAETEPAGRDRGSVADRDRAAGRDRGQRCGPETRASGPRPRQRCGDDHRPSRRCFKTDLQAAVQRVEEFSALLKSAEAERAASCEASRAESLYWKALKRERDLLLEATAELQAEPLPAGVLSSPKPSGRDSEVRPLQRKSRRRLPRCGAPLPERTSGNERARPRTRLFGGEIASLKNVLAAARDVGKAALASLRTPPMTILPPDNKSWLGLALGDLGNRSAKQPLLKPR